MDERRIVRIADCGRWYSGGTPSKAISEYWIGSIPWVSPKDMDQRFIYDAEDHISQNGVENGSRLIPANSILFVVRSMTLANRFQIAITRREVAFNQDLKAIVCNSEVYPEYLFYCISAQSNYILEALVDEASHGTKRLKTEAIGDLLIPLPSLQEQREIAHVFKVLDEKIELNRRMNATLEESARALFKSWFVDFDPVRAKMDGRQPDGMDAETAALFPDRLVESELGPIPEGWRVGTLNEITNFVLGGDWGKDEPDGETTEPVYCIRGADIPDLQNAGFGKMPLRYLKASSLEKRSLRFGDLVVEISGGSPTQSTGRPVFIRPEILFQLGYPLTCSNFCRLVRLNTVELSTYAYYWMSNLYSRDAFLQYETGTTGIKNFAFKIFSETHKMLIPQDAVLKMYRDIIDGLQAQQHHNGNNSRTLAETRDVLLPKLLSGEVSTLDIV